MTQYFNAASFTALTQAGIDTYSRLAASALSRTERLIALNIGTSRSMFEDSIASTNALLAAKSPQELGDAHATLLQPAVEGGVALARSAYEIILEGQQEAANLAESQITELKKVLTNSFEQVAQSAPAGTESVFAAIKSVLAANSNAYDTFSLAAKQAAELAQANVAAATDAASKVVSLTKKAA